MIATQELLIDETEVIRELCKESFYDFVVEFWDTIIPEKPVYNWHIRYLCDELQYVAERVFRGENKEYDLIINISPGSTKSTLCSIMFPAWVWCRMESARIIGGSYSANLALDLALKNRDIIQSDKYMKCWPNIQLRSDQSAKSNFANNKGGVRYCVGVGGSVTGRHAHFIIIDDPLNPIEAASELDLKSANKWMSETLPTRKVDKAVTPTILIMQRLHQNDCTQEMLDRANVGGSKIKHICLPAEIGDNVKPDEIKDKYIKGLMDPIRLSEKILKEAKSYGEYSYAGQYLQRPVPEGGAMFKFSKIEIIPETPKDIKRMIRYWDKAGTSDDGAYTVGVLMGIRYKGEIKRHQTPNSEKSIGDKVKGKFPGIKKEGLRVKDRGRFDVEGEEATSPIIDTMEFVVIDVRRGRWSSEERERIIYQTATMDGREVEVGIEQEPGSGGKESAEATVKRLAGWRVKVDKPTGNKEFRADPFSVQVNVGNVKIVRGEWNIPFLSEMEYFPRSQYKDQIDAASGAFNILSIRKKVVGGWTRISRLGRH